MSQFFSKTLYLCLWMGMDYSLKTLGQRMFQGELPYKRDGDALRKIRIKPLRETNPGVVQALFDP